MTGGGRPPRPLTDLAGRALSGTPTIYHGPGSRGRFEELSIMTAESRTNKTGAGATTGNGRLPTAKGSKQTADGEELGILLSSVAPERVEWLWPGRIPLGK